MHQPMKKLFGAVFILTLLSACSLPSSSSVPQATNMPTDTVAASTITAAATEAPTQAATEAAAGACANPYYPVKAGATWSYQSTGSIAGTYKFTDTISDVQPNGFTLTTQFDKLTRTQEWSCDDDGLKALELGGGLEMQNMNLQVETQNATGVSYPKIINVGDQWDYTLDFTGKMTIGGNAGEAKGSETVHYTAIGMENVTVPAGTFDALKIQGVTTLNVSVTYQGLTIPVAFTSTYDSWLVKDVGMVKSQGTASINNSSFTENIELQTYNIP